MRTTDDHDEADSSSITSMQSTLVNPTSGVEPKDHSNLEKTLKSNVIALSHLKKKAENIIHIMRVMEHSLGNVDSKLEEVLNRIYRTDPNLVENSASRSSSAATYIHAWRQSDEAGGTDDCTMDTKFSLASREDGQESIINEVVNCYGNPVFAKTKESNKLSSTNSNNEQSRPNHTVLMTSAENGIDFGIESHNFTQRRMSWNERLGELRLYKEDHGDCNVPQSYIGGLGAWVSAQRAQHKFYLAGKSSSMSHTRKDGLEKLGFTWALRKRASWEERFEELKKYSQNHHGSCEVPSHKTYKHLWTWCQNQRQIYRRGKEGKGPAFSPERIILMESIGFKWS